MSPSFVAGYHYAPTQHNYEIFGGENLLRQLQAGRYIVLNLATPGGDELKDQVDKGFVDNITAVPSISELKFTGSWCRSI